MAADVAYGIQTFWRLRRYVGEKSVYTLHFLSDPENAHPLGIASFDIFCVKICAGVLTGSERQKPSEIRKSEYAKLETKPLMGSG